MSTSGADALAGALGPWARAVRAHLAALARETGLPVGAKTLLGEVVSRGTARASDLAHDLGAEPSVMSRQLGHLLELGLLERSVDAQDRRVQLLSVTEEGRRRLEALTARQREMLDGALVGWGEDELEDAARVLRRLAESLHAATPSPTTARGGEAAGRD